MLFSEDGRSWVEVIDFRGTICQEMIQYDDHLAVAVQGNLPGVWFSHDRGETWNPPPWGAPMLSRITCAFGGEVFGVVPGDSNCSGFWCSSDFGESWELIFNDAYMSDSDCSFGYLMTGWDGEVPEANEGVAVWDPFLEMLIWMNEGLPCRQVNRISKNSLAECENTIVCTENGAYFTTDFPDINRVTEVHHFPPLADMDIFPNPFNQQATVSFEIPASGYTTLSLFDLTGRKIRTLFESDLVAGTYQISLMADNISSGTYLVQADLPGSGRMAQRILLLK